MRGKQACQMAIRAGEKIDTQKVKRAVVPIPNDLHIHLGVTKHEPICPSNPQPGLACSDGSKGPKGYEQLWRCEWRDCPITEKNAAASKVVALPGAYNMPKEHVVGNRSAP